MRILSCDTDGKPAKYTDSLLKEGIANSINFG
jgi:hypothetical protein